VNAHTHCVLFMPTPHTEGTLYIKPMAVLIIIRRV